MDLIFSNDSPRSTTLSLPTGEPVYEVSTSDRVFHTPQTTIKKFQSGSSSTEPQDMALIELHRLHMSIVKGWGKSVVPRSDGVFKSGRTFTSSNGQKYTWKRQTRTAKLTDKSDNTLAVFQERSIDVTTKEQEPSLAKLSITPDAVGLAHEIVGTFIYVEPAG